MTPKVIHVKSLLAAAMKAPPTTKQNGMQIPEALTGEFGDFVMWDGAKKGPVAVSRDAMGEQFAKTVGIDPTLEGTFEITLADDRPWLRPRWIDTEESRLAGFDGQIAWDTSKPNGQPRRKLDTSRAKQLFGFESRTTFEAGLRETIDWYVAIRSSGRPLEATVTR